MLAASEGLRVLFFQVSSPFSSTQCSADRIANGVARLLAEPTHRAGAQRLAQAMAAERREDLAVTELEALAARSSNARAGRTS